MDNWKKNLYVLWGTQLLVMIGINMVIPFLPFYVMQLGVSNPDEVARWSGLVYSGTFMTSFIATPLWGKMGDKYGRKMMVVRALFGLGLAQIFIGLAQNVIQLFLFRLLQGAISGFIAASLALVSTSTPKERIGYALGVLQSATAGGSMIGPAVGGFLADMIGYREIFFIIALFCFVGGFIVIKLVQGEQSAHDSASPSVLQNFKLMLTHRHLRIISITIILSQMASLMIEPLFALFVETFKATTTYISTYTGITIAISGIFMVISSPWWGKRNDKYGFKQNLIMSLTWTGIAYSLHMIIPTLLTLAVLRAVLGFARGGILHSLYSMTSLHAPEDRKSGLIGIASSFTILGNMFGPISGGMIAGYFGLSGVFIINSTMFIISSIIIWRFYHEQNVIKAEIPLNETRY